MRSIIAVNLVVLVINRKDKKNSRNKKVVNLFKLISFCHNFAQKFKHKAKNFFG